MFALALEGATGDPEGGKEGGRVGEKETERKGGEQRRERSMGDKEVKERQQMAYLASPGESGDLWGQ